MTRWILDASVAAKWYLPATTEPFALEAYEIFARWRRNEIKLIVPDHFWVELGAVLWKAVRQGRLDRDSAQSGMRRLLGQDLPVVSGVNLIEAALAIALEHQRTVYDTLYVALAIQESGEMITADERLVNALGSRFPVRWLGSYQQMH